MADGVEDELDEVVPPEALADGKDEIDEDDEMELRADDLVDDPDEG